MSKMDHRLQDIAKLDKGWLDGEGDAFSDEAVQWFAQNWTRCAVGIAEPYVYPLVEGGLSLEWDSHLSDVLVEVLFESKEGRAYFGDSAERLFQLDTEAGWQALGLFLRSYRA